MNSLISQFYERALEPLKTRYIQFKSRYNEFKSRYNEFKTRYSEF